MEVLILTGKWNCMPLPIKEAKEKEKEDDTYASQLATQ